MVVASQNEVFGSSLAAHLNFLNERLLRAQEEFSAALADLAAGKSSASANQAKQVNPSHFPKLRRILAPSSKGVAPRIRAGDDGVGPNPPIPTRPSTHGRFYSFLVGLRAHRRAARRLNVAMNSNHR